MQEEAAAKTVEAQAGGGMVKVVVDGSMRVRKIEIDPALLAANDRAMLQDLIVVAINDGLRRAQESGNAARWASSPAAGGTEASRDGRRLKRARWPKISNARTACRPR